MAPAAATHNRATGPHPSVGDRSSALDWTERNPTSPPRAPARLLASEWCGTSLGLTHCGYRPGNDPVSAGALRAPSIRSRPP